MTAEEIKAERERHQREKLQKVDKLIEEQNLFYTDHLYILNRKMPYRNKGIISIVRSEPLGTTHQTVRFYLHTAATSGSLIEMKPWFTRISIDEDEEKVLKQTTTTLNRMNALLMRFGLSYWLAKKEVEINVEAI